MSLWVVGGGKGGVGKSMVASGVLDWLRTKGDVLLVESDDSNPDVAKAAGDNPTEICALDGVDGWIKLGNLLEGNPGANVVLNTAARATNALIQNLAIVADVASSQKAPIHLLWPINRQRDSLELLKQVVDAGLAVTTITGIINTYFGPPEKFTRFHGSKLKTRVSRPKPPWLLPPTQQKKDNGSGQWWHAQ